MVKTLRAAIGAATMLAALQAPPGRAEEAWAACIAAPIRACVLALAAEAAASNDDAYQKVHLFGELGAAEAKAGLAAEADRDFARVSAIIDAEQGVGADVRRAQYTDALAAELADAGRVDAALALVKTIDAQYPASALGPIAARQARDGHPTDAAETAALAAERSRKVVLPIMKFDAYFAAAQAARAAGRTEEANAAESEAMAAARFGASASSRDYSRSRIAEDQEARGDGAAASRTLSNFETTPQRDREALQLARAALSAGRFDEAARFVETISGPSKLSGLTMLAMAPKKHGVNPQSSAAAAEVRRIAAAATGDERARLLVDLGQIDAAQGDDAAAAADFAQARARAESLSGEARSMFSLRLANGLLSSGKIADALALVDEFKQPMLRDLFLQNVSETQMAAGGVADALRSIQSVSDPRFQVEALARLAETLAR